jgi:hypothetical protein
MDFLEALGKGTKIFSNRMADLEDLIDKLITYDYIFLVRSDQMSVEVLGKDGELYND